MPHFLLGYDLEATGLSDIKKELQEIEPKVLIELCLKLAKYKRDNKDFLGYLLFKAHDKTFFLSEIKTQVQTQFSEINKENNLYYIKKSLRKILRQIVKYCRYLDDKALAADLHIYFCLQLKNSGIPFEKNKLIHNMYEQEIKKIKTFIASLHPDLQNDYHLELEKLLLNDAYN